MTSFYCKRLFCMSSSGTTGFCWWSFRCRSDPCRSPTGSYSRYSTSSTDCTLCCSEGCWLRKCTAWTVRWRLWRPAFGLWRGGKSVNPKNRMGRWWLLSLFFLVMSCLMLIINNKLFFIVISKVPEIILLDFSYYFENKKKKRGNMIKFLNSFSSLKYSFYRWWKYMIFFRTVTVKSCENSFSESQLFPLILCMIMYVRFLTLFKPWS